MGVVLKTNDEVVTFEAPQASAKAGAAVLFRVKIGLAALVCDASRPTPPVPAAASSSTPVLVFLSSALSCHLFHLILGILQVQTRFHWNEWWASFLLVWCRIWCRGFGINPGENLFVSAAADLVSFFEVSRNPSPPPIFRE